MVRLRIIGYTEVSNRLMEALAMIRIPGEARQVLDVIVRRTYGWHTQEVEIELSEFSEATGGLSKVHVCRALAKLRDMNLIIVKTDEKPRYSVQEDVDQWRPLPKKVTPRSLPNRVINVTQKGNGFLLEEKERNKLPPYNPPMGDGDGNSLLQDRFNRFVAAYPKIRSLGRAWKVWCTIQPTDELVEEMLSTIKLAKESA